MKQNYKKRRKRQTKQKSINKTLTNKYAVKSHCCTISTVYMKTACDDYSYFGIVSKDCFPMQVLTRRGKRG